MAKRLQGNENEKDLLSRAKELVESGNGDQLSLTDISQLIHDLRFHQMELETRKEELQQAQREAEESRDQLAELFDFVPVGFFTLDEHNIILQANQTSAALLGVERSQLIQKRFSSYLAEESQDTFYLFRRVLIETKSPQTCELKISTSNGMLFHAELKAAGKFDTDGNLIRLSLALHDVTKRRQAEDALRDKIDLLSKSKRYEAIIGYITRVVHRSIDLKEVMQNAVEALSDNIEGTDFVSIYMVEGNEAVLMAQKGFPDQYLRRAGRIPHGKGATWKTLVEGTTIYTPDADQDTVLGPAGRDIGTKSYLSTPIHFEGKPIGTLNINSLRKEAFDEEELKLLEIVAGQIEIAMNNAQQAESLRVSRENYRHLFDNVPVGIYRTTPDGRILMANSALVQMLGYSSFEELALNNLEDKEFALRIPRAKFKQIIESAGHAKGLESVWVRRDGSSVHVCENARAVKGEHGSTLYYEGTVEDITERKTTEHLINDNLARLDKKNRYETIISSITRSVHSSIDLQEVLDNAVDAMIENIEDLDNIYISLVEGDKALLRAYRGYPTWFVEQVRQDPFPEGTSWNTVLELKTKNIADADEDTSENSAEREAITRSYLSMPIHVHDQTVGIININSLKNDAFEEEELKLLDVVSRQIEIAINNAHQAEELKRAKEGLEVRVMERTKELIGANESLQREITWHKWAEQKLRTNEELYRALYDENPSMYFTVNEEGKILSVNKFGAERLGFSTHELIGQSMLNIVHHADREKVSNIVKRCFDNKGELIQGEFRKVHKDKSIMWVRESARAADNVDGGAVALIVSEDISDRKRIEDALRRHSEILDLANDTIIIRDLDDTIIYWNQGAEWLYGWTKEEALGRNIHELLRTNFPQPLEKIRETLQHDEYWEGEVVHTKRDAGKIIVSSRWTLQSATEENPPVILEINNDITERKQAEEKLRESEERYRTLFSLVPIAVYSCDADGVIQELNQSAVGLWGREPERGNPSERFCGSFKLFYPDGRYMPHEECPMAKVLRGEVIAPKDSEILVETPSGLRKNVIALPQPLKNDKGEIIGAINCLYDITERKQTEETLRQQKELYEAILKAQSDVGECFFILEGGRIIYANDACNQITGYSLAELSALPSFSDLIVPEEQSLVRTQLESLSFSQILKGRYEINILNKNQEKLTLEISAYPLRMRTSTQLIMIGRDVTERKRTEQKLMSHAQQQAAIAELGKLALMGVKLSTLMDEATVLVVKTLEVDFCKVLELLPDGNALLLLSGAGWKEGYVGYATVESGADSQAGYTLTCREPVVVEDLSTETRFSGPPLLHEHNVTSGISVIIQGNDRPFGVLGTHTIRRQSFTQDDVNFIQAVANILAEAIERKRAEEALRESEHRFSSFMSHLPGAAWIKDANGRYVYANQIGQKIFNKTLHNMLGKTDDEIFDIDTANQFKQNDLTVINSKESLQTIEMLPREDGLHHSIVSKFPIFDNDGNPKLVGGIAIDITERKQAEEALRESEERFRTLADSAPVLIWVNGPEGCQFVNREYINFLGCDEEELLGLGWTRFVHPEDYERYVEGYRAIAEKQEPFASEVRLLHADGQWRWVFSRGLPRFTPSGQYIGYVGCSTDITELKLAEQRLVLTYNQAAVGICECDLEGRFLEVNHKFCDISGYSREELLTMRFQDITYPDDIQPDLDQYRRLQASEIKSYTMEKRYIRKGGQIIWISLIASLVRDPLGAPKYGIGIVEDITDRKEAQEILLRFKFISDNSNDPQFLLNRQGNIVYVNQVARERLGYSEEELLHMNIVHIDGFYDKKKVKELFTLSKKERLSPFESVHQRKDGSFFPVETSLTGVTFNNEPYLFAVARDITERKRTDEKLKASLKEKEVLLKEIHHRVKNNLQIIHSLLSMQARRIKDNEIRDEVNDSRSRVEAMSLIHEKLYQPGNPAVVDLSKYIKSLSKQLVHSYETGSKVKLKISANNVLLPVDKAVPCGLILNELISNSLKHAFPHGKEGEIRISAHADISSGKSADSCNYTLTVGDNGVEFPKDVDFRSTKSLGLQLVCSLTKQLKGTIELDTRSGTEFTIKFSA